MTTYTIINPSDPYTLIADDLVLAAISVCLLGSGKYALEAADGSEGVPFFLFGGHDEWFAAHGAGSLDAALTAATGQRAEALAKVLESVTIVGARSSLNDIGEAAARLAAGVRKLVPHTPERTPYDAMGPVDAPNPPAARATLADVQPGGRVRLGDQAERARFEAWARAECLSLHRYDSGPYSYERTFSAWLAWQAALSAKPSPGGQSDVPEIEQIRTLVSSILSTVSLGHQRGPYAYAGEDFGRYLAEATRDCRTILRALSDLAARQPSKQPDSVALGEATEFCIEKGARQPVWEPIGWFTDDHLTDRSATTYDRTVADRWRAKGWPVSPLYAAPAQAVDLGQLPRVIELLSNVSRTLVDWAADEQREAIGIVKALIDGKAVGNG
ncbi:hypothetical protein EGJ24_01155 [Stenotrophomonas maltophilia]|uniref:hypothetical protein n=1 Tax=Stenotrophomonas maltophilia TaxID=40324 RepID=UPI000F76B167|nr:hypothetical protein [Stenotrophomonas maltophilia]RRU90009.1 hypothetical protein EGJ24_01155 [Stenotrophomonas maltophilia]